MAGTDKPNLKRPYSQVDGSNEDVHTNFYLFGWPFDAPDADCILRSADGVDFRVHIAVLVIASPFFQTMFTLPRPTTYDGCALPIIPVSETSITLNLLLRLCYPLEPPPLDIFNDLIPLYDSVEKYDMAAFLPYIRKALVTNASQDPVGAYAFGYRRQLQDLVIAAAKLTLQNPLSELEYSPQLDYITGTQLQKLHYFHRRCKIEIKLLAKSDWSWIGSLSKIPLASQEERCDCQMTVTMYGKQEFVGAVKRYNAEKKETRWEFAPPTWWWDFMKQAESALEARPLGCTVTAPAFYASTLGEASKCEDEECEKGVELMLEFIQRFGRKIDEAVHQIALDVFDFDC